MYGQGKIETRSCNGFCSKNAKDITCSDFVFVALLIQHVQYDIVICGLYGCIIFFLFISRKTRLKKNLIEHKILVLRFCTFVSKIFYS
jgi:predicted histidine transporter YuiF (NhaC family)